MHHAGVASGCMLTVLCAAAAFADGETGRVSSPELSRELSPALCIHAAGKAIDTKAVHAAPCLADWNGDGRPDLLLGEASGRLRVYLNEGLTAAPRLAAGRFVEAEGEAVHVPPG